MSAFEFARAFLDAHPEAYCAYVAVLPDVGQHIIEIETRRDIVAAAVELPGNSYTAARQFAADVEGVLQSKGITTYPTRTLWHQALEADAVV